MDNTQPLSSRRVAVGIGSLLGGVALSAAAVIGVAAGVGAVWHATNPSVAPAAAATPASSGGASLTLTIKMASTPGGEAPVYVGSNGVGAPILATLTAGVPTSVTIVNKSPMPHTFTSAALGVNETIPPGPSTVHFTVKATKTGLVSWDCEVPCGSWVMSHAGYMTGELKVVS